MKSYFIFTIVLTVAYLVYYAVIIVQDLYGKKGNGKPEEEVFDLGAPEDEQSVYVTESDTGFNVGNEKYETDVAPTASPAPQETETADNNGEIAVAEKLKSPSGGTDGRNRDLPVRRIHGRRTVQSDACQRKDGQPSGTGVETSQRPIVKCRKQKKYYVHCALSLMRHSPKVAA